MILGFFTPFATFAENNDQFKYDYSSAIECSDGTSSAEYCNSLYGCYSGGHMTTNGEYSCKPCPTGTYKGKGDSCDKCPIPNDTDNLQFEWSHPEGLHDTDGCIWRVICPKGYYAATGSSNNLACHPCKGLNRYDNDDTANYYKGRSDIILAYHSDPWVSASDDYPSYYEIVDEGLYPGTRNTDGKYGCGGVCPENAQSNDYGTGCECVCGYEFSESNVCKPKTISFYYYMAKDDTTPEHTDSATYVPNQERTILNEKEAKNHGFTKTGYTIANWKFKNSEKILDLGASFKTPPCDSIDLYAIFEPNTFTITYTANGKECTTQGCKYDDTNCYAKAQDVCTEHLSKGEYITHWTYNGQNYEPGGDDSISNISDGTNFTMVADVKTCENGYHCASGVRNKCPAGATSDSGSSAITDCYLHGEQTIIKDKYGNEFSLPENIKINYHKLK